MGFDAGNLRDFVSLPMSRTMAILDVCRTSNVPGGAPGLYRFQIRGGGVAGGDCVRPACETGVRACTIRWGLGWESGKNFGGERRASVAGAMGPGRRRADGAARR